MNKMTDLQLAQLYRRMTMNVGPGDIDGAQLLDCLQGNLTEADRNVMLAKVAGSPAIADVARLLNALAADSEQLAAQVDSLKTHQLPAVAHARGRGQRAANGRRMARVSAAWLSVAACLVAVIGVWNMERNASTVRDAQMAQPAAALPDVIFASADRIFASTTESPAPAVQDRLFSSRFAGS